MKTKFVFGFACQVFSRVICSGAIILICSNASAQNLFMSAGDKIIEFTPEGVQSTFASGLSAEVLAFDSAGNLFASVADCSVVPCSRAIYKFTPDGVQSTFASGVGAGALAFDSAGNLFVTDGNSILKFTSEGVQSTFAFGLSGPTGLAFDSKNNLFVTDYGTGSILKFTPDGVRTTFVRLSNPISLAVDDADNLYVTVDGWSGVANKIYKITPQGTTSIFADNLLFPEAMTFDSNGNLFVEIDGLTDYPSYTLEIARGGRKTTFTSEFGGSIAFQPMSIAPTPTPTPTATPTPTPPFGTPTPTATPIQTVATPVISPSSGTFKKKINVKLSCATTGATIHYTVDGSDPSASSAVYKKKFKGLKLSGVTVYIVKAMATKSGYNNSSIATAIFSSYYLP